MKNRFNSYDIICMVSELQRLIGMRVNQVYDIDNKTYVIRFQHSEEKVVLLLESGSRFHTTQFEWPKNVAPSGFTMKLRKHLKNKRLEKLCQLGVDRIVDLQFGSGEAAYHIIMELYDRGNIILTDYELTILNVLRPHVEQDKIRVAVKEKYPLDRVKTSYEVPSEDILKEVLTNAKPGDTLKKILNPKLEFGSAIIDHVLLVNGLAGNMKVSKDPNKGFELERDFEKLVTALKLAQELFENVKDRVSKGFIIQKKEEWPDSEGSNYLMAYQEFHPMLFAQFKSHPHAEHETFDRAVDEFFSALEGQKIDLKTLQIEREAMKKLANVRKDHEKRVSQLASVQVVDRRAAEMIARNDELVERARLAVQTALANQLSWDDIKAMVKTAQDNKDPVALAIKHLKLNTNHITMLLTDPYHDGDEEGNEERLDPMLVDIDLSLSAFANARRYYDQKRNAAKKQQKTLESAGKALKSAERKTKQTLKEANTISNISKARKTYWFEKFYWFISSDNYLVIAGRDQQQNEMLVKRYMRAGDLYVHAEVTGASSVIVKNPSGQPVPPRTLSEAGQAAVAYSVSWEAKVLTRAWWVHAHQVSKSAPTGEYLSTGSFMIRGRKNYLLPEHLQFGFSFMFRLEEGSIERHRDDRRVLMVENTLSDVSSLQDTDQDLADIDIPVSDDDGDDDEPSEKEEVSNGSSNHGMETINEETYTNAHSNQNEYTEPVDDLDNDGDEQETHKQEKEDESEEDSGEENEEVNNVDNIDKGVETLEIKSKSNSEVDIEANNRRNREDLKGIKTEESKTDVKINEHDIDSDSDDDEGVLHTHIKIDHETGKVFTKTRTMSEMSDKKSPEEEKLLSFPALPKKGRKKNPKKEAKKEDSKQEKAKDGMKRGQKGKLKKMKEKYKNQDEEDRVIRMELLKPSLPEKESKKAEKAAKKAKVHRGGARQGAKIPAPAPLILEIDEDAELEPEPEPEVEQSGVDASTELLCQLTGSPCEEDELLFAVPVVAPYSALLNYKYKVKLLPGTSKRGKAAKTAVAVFLRDRGGLARERDLLKAVREEDIARNFPGKVKLSAPQLHKHRK